MVALGAVFAVGGGVLTFLAVNAIASGVSSALAIGWSVAAAAGPSLSGFGILLLLIAWIISAAKWQRPD